MITLPLAQAQALRLWYADYTPRIATQGRMDDGTIAVQAVRQIGDRGLTFTLFHPDGTQTTRFIQDYGEWPEGERAYQWVSREQLFAAIKVAVQAGTAPSRPTPPGERR